MQVIRAPNAGFCMGVARAIKILDKALNDPACRKPIFTLGPIIHNPQVLEYYESLGVRHIQQVDGIPSASTLVLRAHGIPRHLEQALQKQGFALLDATCPKVKKAQEMIAERAALDEQVLIFGEKEHPEVKGLYSYAGADALIFDSLERLRACPVPRRPFCLAAQTTQDRAAFNCIVHFLRAENPAMPFTVLDTICNATKIRQEEVRGMCAEVEAMVVVGGRQSGNTRRLAHIAEQNGLRCFLVETTNDLPREELRAYKTIGLSAGASTPGKLIDQVEQFLKGL